MKIQICFILLIVLSSFSIQNSFGATNEVLSQSVSDYTFIENSTDPNSKPEKVSSYYLLAGKEKEFDLFSKVYVNVPKLPVSDIWRDIHIDSAKLKIMVVLTNGTSEDYFLTTRLCLDGFEDKLNDRWLSQISTAQSFTSNGDFKTDDCTRTSPQDSVIVNKYDIPKIYELDVTNLTRELVAVGSNSLIYVITATPVNNYISDYSIIPESGYGVVGISSKSDLQTYGSNTVATLSLIYTTSPTQFSENWNTMLSLLPGFLGVIVSIVIYFAKQKSDRTNLIKRSTKSLLTEIESNEEALTGKQGYKIVEYTGFDTDKSKIKYTNAFLDFDSYENLINSGQFSYFKIDAQTSLRELYTRIKDHNRTLIYIDELEDKFKINFPDDDKRFLMIIARYEAVITLWEKEILELIPVTKEKLKMK